MQPAFFTLMLAALHLFSLETCCKPVEWDLSRPHRRGSHKTRFLHQKKLRGIDDLFLKKNWSGQLRNLVSQESIVILPIRKDSTDFVSIFDLRKKRFLCVDFEGTLLSSLKVSREECLFQDLRFLQENRLDGSDSSRPAGLSPQLSKDIRETTAEDPKPLKPSSVLLVNLLLSRVHRTRRSQQVSDPSDPLRTENNRQPRLTEERRLELRKGQPEKEQSGAVSKETITSCDDPLQVLHSNGPVSPIKTNIEDRTVKE